MNHSLVTGRYGSCVTASSSYRDLLGTADRIIHLDQQLQETEKVMGEVSLQCNLDVIDQKARHLAQLQEQAAQQSSFLLSCYLCDVKADVIV